MKLIKKYIFIILIAIAVVGIVGGICLKKYLNNKESNLEELVQEESLEVVEDEEEVEEIFVSIDIKGAVNKPGVYKVQNDKKVIDVVNMASGFTDEADTSLVNLARGVTDEMVIVIYTKNQVKEAKKNAEVSIVSNDTCVCPKVTNDACLNNSNTNKNNTSNKNSSSDKSSSDSSTNENSNKNNVSHDKININTATLEELMTLSGIGESKAQSIIDYRNEMGSFSTIEDIMNVSGIGESAFEKIKEYITV